MPRKQPSPTPLPRVIFARTVADQSERRRRLALAFDLLVGIAERTRAAASPGSEEFSERELAAQAEVEKPPAKPKMGAER